MKIELTEAFLHDVDDIADPKKREKIEKAIFAVMKADKRSDIPSLRKLQGVKGGIHYRIRVGDLRT